MANPKTEQHSGWRDENIRVQDARRTFIRQAREALQVDGLPTFDCLPSERRGASGIDTLSYYTYPLLFYGLFPRVSLAQLRALSVCGSYLFDYALSLDRLIDHPARSDLGALLLSQRLHREALGRLGHLFGPGHAFWGYFDRYTAELMQAALRERARHCSLVTPYRRSDLEQIYAGKAALAKVCLAALALLDGSEPTLERLAASHDAFYVGFQLFDDLQDWRLDYQSRRYSYPLTEVLLRAGLRERAESAERPPAEEVGELLRSSDVLEECRALALEYLARAEGSLETMGDGSWARAIRQTGERIRAFRLDHTEPQEQPGPPPGPAWDALGTPVATPIAARWRPWLDPARAPLIHNPRLLAAQRQYLERAEPAATLGLAVCQVGLAIDASLERYPDIDPAQHLGVRPAELVWCRSNDGWLEALLALALDQPAESWASAPDSRGAEGWLSPAVGRFLGYHLVQSYRAERGSPPSAQALLADYRRKLIG